MSVQPPGSGSLADQFRNLLRRVEELSRRNPSSSAGATWTALPLANGWVARSGGYFPPEIRRMPDGTIRLRGSLANGTNTDGTTIATIPDEFRPTALVVAPVGSAPSSRIQISPSGVVLIYGVTRPDLGLDGVTYTTD